MPSLPQPVEHDTKLQALYADYDYKNHIKVPTEDFWVFGYGSLVWNPGFVYKRTRKATVFGYHRQFCVASKSYRGTPQKPGLVLGLRPGGSVTGRAFLVDKNKAATVIEYLERRELRFEAYEVQWVCASFSDGNHARSLSFVISESSPHFVHLGEAEIVHRLATCSGKAGSNREYLDNLCADLKKSGISLGSLEKIQRKVAQYLK